MASLFNFFCAITFLSLISQGYGLCSIADVVISQSKTGKLIRHKPEWEVTISNNCQCTQLQLQLDCKGFRSEKEIDPSILSKSGDQCLVNNGQPIYGFKSFSFTYAWGSPFPFNPVSSQLACS